MLGPGALFELKARLQNQSQESMQRVFQGGREIFIWGEVRYKDAFKIGRGFRFKMIADLTSMHWGFRPTPDGNEEY